MTFSYSLDYAATDFREHPELYRVGKGEQGVLLVEPYKSEILPHWRFKTAEIAEKSAQLILELFNKYKKNNDFVGADMARKFLQMGFTRARRYANHPSGRKWNADKTEILPQATDHDQSEKAKAAKIFYTYYEQAKNDTWYKEQKKIHQEKYG